MAKILHPLSWVRKEVRLIGRRGRTTWKLVPARHKWALAIAAILMGLTSTASTIIPLLLGRLVARLQGIAEAVRSGGPAESMLWVALTFLGFIGGIYLVRELIHVLRRFLVENTCTSINRDMTVRTLKHVLKADLQNFTHEKVGALHTRVCRSVDGFVRFLRLSFLDFFPVILTGLFALIVTLWKAPLLGLVMIGVIPTSVVLTLWQLISQKNVRLRLMRTRETMDGTMVEQLGGLDYVRAANTIEDEVERVAKSAEKLRSREIKHHFQMSLFGCAKALNEGFFHILVLAIGVYMAVHGQIHFHEIFTNSMLFLNVMAPLSEASLRVGDLVEILKTPIDQSFRTPEHLEPDFKAEPLIQVENLEVEYDTADGQTKRALEGVSFAINRGERIGIAGKSGGGKSTWLKVLLRLTHPLGGRITFGGVPLERVSRESIAELVGYVGQQPFVFEGTVAENIAYGVPGATRQKIRRAAELACIHDEIMAMPGGYDAPVAERGANLSGGQKQRLAIARLFLKDPPVMILDEATSALDTISERAVQKAISETQPDRTVIIVAHRLSTLLDTDRVLVFDQGRIVESGPFNDLVQQGGIFTELLMSAQTPSSPGPNAAEEAAPAAPEQEEGPKLAIAAAG
jgi:ATP-binding cassette subfamily B protein